MTGTEKPNPSGDAEWRKAMDLPPALDMCGSCRFYFVEQSTCRVSPPTVIVQVDEAGTTVQDVCDPYVDMDRQACAKGVRAEL